MSERGWKSSMVHHSHFERSELLWKTVFGKNKLLWHWKMLKIGRKREFEWSVVRTIPVKDDRENGCGKDIDGLVEQLCKGNVSKQWREWKERRIEGGWKGEMSCCWREIIQRATSNWSGRVFRWPAAIIWKPESTNFNYDKYNFYQLFYLKE